MQPPAKFVCPDAPDHARCSFIDNDHKTFRQNRSPAESSNSSTALSNLNVCTRHGISFEIKWIPRSFNYQADLWSRTIHFDDYTIHDEVFHMLDRKWGTHTVVICLPVVITPRFGVTIPCFTSLARKP